MFRSRVTKPITNLFLRKVLTPVRAGRSAHIVQRVNEAVDVVLHQGDSQVESRVRARGSSEREALRDIVPGLVQLQVASERGAKGDCEERDKDEPGGEHVVFARQ